MADKPRRSSFITAVVANVQGEIFELEGYAAVGADGGRLGPLGVAQTRLMPFGTELMFLPQRVPLLFNLRTGRVEKVERNPFALQEPLFPVAAFNSPGVLITHTCAYSERPNAAMLPLFSYGAVGWHQGRFRTAIVEVDREPRQDLRRMPRERIVAGVTRMRRLMPDNRLRAHLEKCALTYGCPAGKNFFLARYEAPLPAATTCNARCLGCISLQSDSGLCSSQERIAFTPTPQEIAEVALTHIRNVPRAVVSFGQGCEGDPLLVSDTIEAAIRLIRRTTAEGTININTNASLPERLAALCAAGLDSVRISLNSLQPGCYTAYYRPRGYGFEDVVTAIDEALAGGVHVALNYLSCPGFTDAPQEVDALLAFIGAHPIRMIQWRNLNFDPVRYLKVMQQAAPLGRPIGMRTLLRRVRKAFPNLHYGYFNPPKENFRPY